MSKFLTVKPKRIAAEHFGFAMTPSGNHFFEDWNETDVCALPKSPVRYKQNEVPVKTDQKNKDRPHGYDSDQGKTQRADQTNLVDVVAAQGFDRENTEKSEGQRETDEGGTSYTRDPNDRPETESSKGANKEKVFSSQASPRGPASGDARAAISPRSI